MKRQDVEHAPAHKALAEAAWHGVAMNNAVFRARWFISEPEHELRPQGQSKRHEAARLRQETKRSRR